MVLIVLIITPSLSIDLIFILFITVFWSRIFDCLTSFPLMLHFFWNSLLIHGFFLTEGGGLLTAPCCMFDCCCPVSLVSRLDLGLLKHTHNYTCCPGGISVVTTVTTEFFSVQRVLMCVFFRRKWGKMKVSYLNSWCQHMDLERSSRCHCLPQVSEKCTLF